MNQIPSNIYHQLYSESNDAILIINRTQILDWNKKASTLLGLNHTYPNPYTISMISPIHQPGGEPSVSLAIEHIQMAKDQGVHTFNWRHQNALTGSVFFAEVHLVKLSGDNPDLFIATIRDISRRIETEKEMLSAKLKYKLLVENSNDIIEIISPEGKPLFISGQITKILGYSIEEAMTHMVFERIHPDDIGHVLAIMSEGFSDYGAKKTVEYRYRHKLGHYVYLEATGCNLLKEPAISGLFLTIKDIDERKKYEMLLLEAKKSAELATETKSQFLANMSHEIRTPINAIIGSCDLLSDGTLTKEQEEYLAFIKTSSRHLKNLVDDVLDFSKIEANMLELSYAWTSLNELIDDVISVFKISAESKGIVLERIIPPNLPSAIYIDALRLKQILINLLGNALKFTYHGSVTLRIAYVKSSSKEGRLTFFVEDTGIGIDTESQKLLFKAFTQADSSTTRKFGGTGLGLIISEMLANKMDSSIQLSSVLGEGSKFYFSIQVPISKSETGDKTIERPISPTHCPDVFSILVVDDMDINRILLVKMLEKLCPEVTTLEAFDGESAIEMYRLHHPDVIFMDLQMPRVDGFDATEQIRAYEEKNSLKRSVIIALTASILSEDKKRSLSIGMNDFLTKPFDKKDLIGLFEKQFIKKT